MKAKPGVALAIAIVGALLMSGCLIARTTDTQTVGPPVAGVTEFGTTFSMDEGRLVVRGVRAGVPEVYVYDSSGSSWTHSATITRPSGGSSYWGRSLAVSGDTIAITDPDRLTGTHEQYGMVTVYNRQAGTWQSGQTLTDPREFTLFGSSGVWLTGSGLVVGSAGYCDSTCSTGSWTLFQRIGTNFKEAYASRPERSAIGLNVGVDQGRIVIANPGYWDIDLANPVNNGLMAFNSNVQLPAIELNEIVLAGEPYEDPLVTDLFRKADIQGDVLAYENRSDADKTLRIRRFNGTAYVEQASFPLATASAGVAVVPGVVLVANPTAGVFQTYVFSDGTWQRSSNLSVPSSAAKKFLTPPVAAGNRVAIRGNNVVHVLTVEAIETDT